MKKWARKVLRAANYTCAVTGQKGGDLSAHHLYNRAHHPEMALDPDNGVCISAAVHKDFHQKYGYGHNTPAQFLEYLATAPTSA